MTGSGEDDVWCPAQSPTGCVSRRLAVSVADSHRVTAGVSGRAKEVVVVVVVGVQRSGQAERKGAALAELGVDGERAAQQSREPLRDGEAEAGAFLVATPAELHELVEDSGLIGGGDAFAAVAHVDLHAAL